MKPQPQSNQDVRLHIEDILDNEEWCGCYEGDIEGCYEPSKKKATKALLDLIETAKAEARKEFADALGKYAHQHYLGCSLEDNVWHYSYDNEVVNLVDNYLATLNSKEEKDV